MSKYIFYENRIYNLDTINNECEDAIRQLVRFDSSGVEYRIRFSIDPNWTDFNKNEWVKIKQHKVVEKLEDLIDIGDLVEYGMFGECAIVTHIDLSVVRGESNWINIRKQDIFKIYKHIGKDFILVCHKYDDEWRID